MEPLITRRIIGLILLLFIITLPLFSLGRADKSVIPSTDNPEGQPRPEPSDPSRPNPEPMPGSFQPVSLDDTGLAEAVYYLELYYAEENTDTSTLKILSAERQVVAGTNYKIQYQLKEGDLLEAKVFIPLDMGDATVTLEE